MNEGCGGPLRCCLLFGPTRPETNLQVIGGFTAFTATVIYMMTHEPDPQAAPPSLGFALDLGNNVTVRRVPGRWWWGQRVETEAVGGRQ